MLNFGRCRSLARRYSVVTVILAAALGGVLAPAPATAANGSCGDGIVVLGARGSGQAANDSNGLGPEVKIGYDELADALIYKKWAASRIRYQAVNYPAQSTDILNPGQILPNGGRNFEIFWNSINIGVDNAITQLYQIQNGLRAGGGACTGGRIVLMGVSQGAMVMHRVLEQLAPGGADANPELFARIGGAVLIADGFKSINDSVIQGFAPTNTYPRSNTYPRFSTGLGNRSYAIGAPKVRPIPLAKVLSTFEVCADQDVVCDAPAAVTRFKDRLDAGGGQRHATIYRNDPLAISRASNALAKRLLTQLPLPRDYPQGTGPTTPPTSTPPTSTPPAAGTKPTGDCNGETVGKSYPVACVIVRRGVPIAPNYENVTTLSGTAPIDFQSGDVTAEGRRQLNRLGIDYKKLDCTDGKQYCDTFTGTPTAKPGVYPFGYTVTQKDGTQPAVKAFVQIVP